MEVRHPHDIVLLLNNILRTFVDPTSFVANRQLLAKFKFDKEIVLSDLVQTYVNLDVSYANMVDKLKVCFRNH